MNDAAVFSWRIASLFCILSSSNYRIVQKLGSNRKNSVSTSHLLVTKVWLTPTCLPWEWDNRRTKTPSSADKQQLDLRPWRSQFVSGRYRLFKRRRKRRLSPTDTNGRPTWQPVCARDKHDRQLAWALEISPIVIGLRGARSSLLVHLPPHPGYPSSETETLAVTEVSPLLRSFFYWKKKKEIKGDVTFGEVASSNVSRSRSSGPRLCTVLSETMLITNQLVSPKTFMREW